MRLKFLGITCVVGALALLLAPRVEAAITSQTWHNGSSCGPADCYDYFGIETTPSNGAATYVVAEQRWYQAAAGSSAAVTADVQVKGPGWHAWGNEPTGNYILRHSQCDLGFGDRCVASYYNYVGYTWDERCYFWSRSKFTGGVFLVGAPGEPVSKDWHTREVCP